MREWFSPRQHGKGIFSTLPEPPLCRDSLTYDQLKLHKKAQ